jgi:hypothetical protein
MIFMRCALLLMVSATLAAQTYTVRGKSVLKSADVQKAISALVMPRAGGGHQLRVAWGKTMALRSYRLTSDDPPRQRSFELGEDHLLVLGVDARGAIRAWTVVANPRLVRAEFPDADGRLSGRVIERPETEILVDLPADPAIREVRVYQPRAATRGFDLLQAGRLTLPRPRR